MMNGIRKFMQGRYGSDALSLFLLCVGIVLNLFIGRYLIGQIVAIAIFAVVIWRMFSRNIYARQKENAAYLRIWYKIKASLPRGRTRKRINALNAPNAGRWCACQEARGKS